MSGQPESSTRVGTRAEASHGGQHSTARHKCCGPFSPASRSRAYAGKDTNVALTIATAEQRLYANLLLQIGVVFPD